MDRTSYARNTEGHAVINETIASRFRHWAEVQHNKPALIVHVTRQQRDIITFGDLYKRAQTLAKYFMSNGVQKGDRVAVFVYNSTEWLIVIAACSLVGAVAVNSFTFISGNLDIVRKLNCKLLILDLRDVKNREFMLMNLENYLSTQKISTKVITVDSSTSILTHQTESMSTLTSLADILASSPDDEVLLPNEKDPDDDGIVFQTSGSTGIPKMPVFTDFGIINNGNSLYTKMDLENKDIFFSDRPMGYMAGFPLPIIVRGCTFVTLSTRSTTRDSLAHMVCEIMKKEGVTSGYLAPYLVFDLEKVKQISPENVPHFKCVVTSGQRLSKTLLQRFQEYSSHAYAGYGTTETGWVTCSSVDDLPDVKDDVLGAPLPLTEMKVIDENGLVVPANTEGEICVRSVSVCRTYLSPDKGSIPLTDDREWFHSGDIGYMLPDGKNFCIKGRKVERIKRLTINIFPATIETVISKHPSVAEVAVVGVPDERMFQEVCACVTLKEGRQLSVPQLESFADDQFKPDMAPDGKGHMPGYFFIFDKFPHLPSQKLDRKALAIQAELRVQQ